jgi:hypothetical protein
MRHIATVKFVDENCANKIINLELTIQHKLIVPPDQQMKKNAIKSITKAFTKSNTVV